MTATVSVLLSGARPLLSIASFHARYPKRQVAFFWAALDGTNSKVSHRSANSRSQGARVASSASLRSDEWNMLPFHQHPSQSAQISNLLVCGDGDLSYSAMISSRMQDLGISLLATVWETQDDHEKVYQFSKQNQKQIVETPPTSSSSDDLSIKKCDVLNNVRFGVDATDLSNSLHCDGSSLDSEESPPVQDNKRNDLRFDRVQFNFPHVKGKANIRYNRELLAKFLKSSSVVLTPNIGEVHVALVDSQGGADANSLMQWKGSWKAAEMAAKAGLLLADVSPFRAADEYRRSSYRGRDRSFNVERTFIGSRSSNRNGSTNKNRNDDNKQGGKKTNGPKLYKFVQSPLPPHTKEEIPIELQLCCRHELHIQLASAADENGFNKPKVDVCTIRELIQSKIVPLGIVVDIPADAVMDVTPFARSPSQKENIQQNVGDNRVAIFLIIYRGARMALTREMADEFRFQVENVLEDKYGYSLREDRKGRMVSNTFPHRVLQPMLDELKLVQRPLKESEYRRIR